MRTPFEGLRPPPPPSELRARVLDAARAAPAETPHWVDLLWESRGFRVALAVAFGLAVAAQLLVRDVPAPRIERPELVEIDGLTLRADRFETDAAIPWEAAQ